MLYDPRWERKTKADPFSLHTLVAWLDTMPSNERYRYFSHGNCALAQYFKAQGFTDVSVSGFTWSSAERGKRLLPKDFEDVPVPEWRWSTFGLSSTFGAALERARAALSSPIRTEP
jgi:hypothetical protein